MTITKDELEKIYNNNTVDKACELLGISKMTLFKYLKENGITLKGKGTKNKLEVV